MPTTLPQLTQDLDNDFVTTWYEIRPDAMDNILNATVIWAALVGAGAMKEQVGSELITRTIKYATATAVDVAEGDTLPQGETESETMAIWRWRYTAGHVQRNIYKDQQNNGPSKIKSYIGQRLDDAMNALEQKYEANLVNPIDTAETAKTMQGLNDLVPPVASRTTGTYGGIARPSAYTDSGNGVFVGSGTNSWWGPKYLAGTLASVEDDILTDMKKLYNSLHNNQVPPNLIIVTQDIYELYEEFGLDVTQIIKDEGTRLMDLGFEVQRFKGKPMIWSPGIDANNVLMLNTDFIEIVYDPNLWFDMTDWKPIPLEAERIAHILCCANMISDQLRRHGRLTYS